MPNFETQIEKERPPIVFFQNRLKMNTNTQPVIGYNISQLGYNISSNPMDYVSESDPTYNKSLKVSYISAINRSDLNSTCKFYLNTILSLSQKTGYCYASDAYFSKIYNKTITTVQRALQTLEKEGYITRTCSRGRRVSNRRIKVVARKLNIHMDGAHILSNTTSSITKKEKTSFSKKEGEVSKGKKGGKNQGGKKQKKKSKTKATGSENRSSNVTCTNNPRTMAKTQAQKNLEKHLRKHQKKKTKQSSASADRKRLQTDKITKRISKPRQTIEERKELIKNYNEQTYARFVFIQDVYKRVFRTNINLFSKAYAPRLLPTFEQLTKQQLNHLEKLLTDMNLAGQCGRDCNPIYIFREEYFIQRVDKYVRNINNETIKRHVTRANDNET